MVLFVPGYETVGNFINDFYFRWSYRLKPSTALKVAREIRKPHQQK